ncbi:sn-glycerol-3-phosphate dehydrogenase subunit C [Mobiluncus mulieris]|uniref:sn-glycerol-3-phosphate dehydrogenase subunit C n=2 Tax=Mobiluncus mulieris TaxID=2052 RepID=A0A8G2HSZ7_9ACTO|nr:sn-glycerol-3-phosphate dehydrogenase subunit C [Mobiluncus mulieris]
MGMASGTGVATGVAPRLGRAAVSARRGRGAGKRVRIEGMEYFDDPLTRAIYASDASNYRIPPARVAKPANLGELRDVVLDALASGTPLTMRGRGTSCAGNSIGPGLVVDTSAGCNRIIDLDPEAHTITVEPGVVLADIQTAGEPYGLRFGPDPSTWTRATIGGSIGNNACGPHAQAWGRVADNVIEMQVIDGFGREFTAGRGEGALDAVPGLERLVQDNLALIRTECGRFSRQVSGYSLEHLLPEKGRDLAKFLAGTEGTLVTILAAKLRLVQLPAAPVLVVLGYPDMIAAAADVPLVNTFKPLAVEGMDSRLVDTLRAKPGAGQIPDLPAGQGWLLVEMGGADEPLETTLARARDLAAAANTRACGVYPPGTEATRLWRIRADGAGLGGRTPVSQVTPDSGVAVHEAPSGNPGAAPRCEPGENSGMAPRESATTNHHPQGNQPAWPGWEDAAVPPENLAAYLQEFTALMRQTGVDGMLYGHLGDGCLHVRLSLPLGAAAHDGRARDFLERAADLVAKYHGSISGEHGDGRARSELLPRMYSPELIALFAKVKALFDPRGLMNPGVLVDPDPLDHHLRLASARDIAPDPSGFAFPKDKDLTAAFHRCTGVGKCLAMSHIKGAWMCPSYLATGKEKDATRGRARALQEVTNGGLIRDFRDPELLRALDLCLACKACSSACPTGIDMSAFRSEAFFRAYRGRFWARPGSHFLLGWLPFWLRLARRVPGGARLANGLFGIDWLRRLVFRLFGLAPSRQMATFATQSFRQWLRREQHSVWRGAALSLGARAREAKGEVSPARAALQRELPLSLSFASRPRRDHRIVSRLLHGLREDSCERNTAEGDGGSVIREKNKYGIAPREQGNQSVTEMNRAAKQREPEERPWVAVWADSFSEGIDPDGAEAVVQLLETAGYRVFVPRQACCGLTYITTGQLNRARRNLRRLCGILGPLAVNGIPIVGVEPSCTATLRDDLERLLPDDPRATAIAQATRTLAELLTDPVYGPGGNCGPEQWDLPDLDGVEVVAQPHCHHYSVLGWSADRELLQRAGAQVTELSGCCGMAGNFGMEAGHLAVSQRVAAHSLLPAFSEHPNAVFLADGFSCRTQASQLAGRNGVHLARLLLGSAPARS